MVRRVAGPRQQEQLGAELKRHDEPHRGGVMVGQLGQHQPVLGHPLHPGADVGHQAARRPDPEVIAPEGPEDPASRGAQPTSSTVRCEIGQEATSCRRLAVDKSVAGHDAFVARSLDCGSAMEGLLTSGLL